jgi:hypothetical protein
MNDAEVLHPTDIFSSADEWFACWFPERPYVSSETWFDERCRGCMVALNANARRTPNAILLDVPGRRKSVTMSDAYEKYRHITGLPPLAQFRPVSKEDKT